MPNYNSIEGNVLFPTIDGYDMHKAGDMALYLAHCDFYPFKSVIDNNKMAIDLVTKAYRDMAQEAREKDDFRTESWAMTSTVGENELYQIAFHFREAIVAAKTNGEFNFRDRMHRFPGGCCDDTCDLLGFYLWEKYRIHTSQRNGYYEAEMTNHAWLITDRWSAVLL